MILTPDVMEDGLVHMVYADEVSGNVLILIVVDKGLVLELLWLLKLVKAVLILIVVEEGLVL